MKKTKKKQTDPKVAFRRSAVWKKLRAKIKKQQKTDFITGNPLTRQYNLHHLDLNPQNYTNIEDESHFIGLNTMSHELVHFVFGDGKNRKDWRNRLKKLEEICLLMEMINDDGQ